MKKFKEGDTVYLLESGMRIREAAVKRYKGEFCIIQFKGGGGIQVRSSRLCGTIEEAEEQISLRNPRKERRNPYDYM